MTTQFRELIFLRVEKIIRKTSLIARLTTTLFTSIYNNNNKCKIPGRFRINVDAKLIKPQSDWPNGNRFSDSQEKKDFPFDLRANITSNTDGGGDVIRGRVQTMLIVELFH